MARKPSKKELVNSRLLKDYASWIYCEGCGKTVAYLCYVTYDCFDFSYACNCGGEGHVCIEFENPSEPSDSAEPLKIVKNRLCCARDEAPLLTIVEKQLRGYEFEIVCNACNTRYCAGR